MKKHGGNKNYAELLLRSGLAIIFTYAAVSSFKNPQDWIGYLPRFLAKSHQAHNLLKVFSIYEIVLALWFVSGKYIKYAALLAALTLAGIVTSNFKLFAITFRDVALIFSALALFALNWDN